MIEVKPGKTINSDYFKDIKYFKEVSNGDEQSYLLYAREEAQKRENISILPWSKVTEIF